MSNLLHIYYTFVLEVHVELDILLNNLDDTSCGIFMRGNRGFSSCGMCRFVAPGVSRRFGGMCRLFHQGFKFHGE